MERVYRLHRLSGDALPPDEPHFACPDGYAWSRRCASPDNHRILVPAEVTSQALDGEPLDRALACAQIVREYGVHTLRLLYPPRCGGCARDHWATDGKRLMRSGLAVHPNAVDYLRRARLPMRAFRVPDVPGKQKRVTAISGYLGLPIRETPEQTLAAQIAYAIKQSPVVDSSGRRGGDDG